jgi:putative nucleotidyltransferase with HDIG domain
MIYTLNLREVTYALSEALDYVGVDDTQHGKRVAFMAAEVAKHLGWSSTQVDEMIMAGMLHDCGVSSTDVHTHLVSELDWDNAQVHCLRGAKLLSQTTLYRQFETTILYHHTHWNALPDTLSAAEKAQANLIYLVDRLDAVRAQLGDQSPQKRRQILQTLNSHSGSLFSPVLVEALMSLGQIDYFWFTLELDPLTSYLNDWIAQGQEQDMPYTVLKNLAIMFAHIVDAKSEFTSEHTYGVAALARFLAERYGLDEEGQNKVELAAFFHDLGKLRVPDAILQKNGPLTENERFLMNRHGFDSSIILRKIKGFQEIARIASLHHETLDGKGYPYHLTEKDIPLEARMVTTADIFQALVQNRPYRAGLTAEASLAIIHEMTNEHKLDPQLVALLQTHLAEAYRRAVHPETVG